MDNAKQWLDMGAGQVIVTSYIFPDGKYSEHRLRELSQSIGKDRLVMDLSCRQRLNTSTNETEWVVAMNKWQTLTDMTLNANVMHQLSLYCAEFLIHAADVEGLCQGIDASLVQALGQWVPQGVPCTYAGGGRTLADLQLVDALSQGRVDLTIGSALDIFGGRGVTLDECVAWNAQHS